MSDYQRAFNGEAAKTIPLWQACARVGRFYDMWVRDPSNASKYLTSRKQELSDSATSSNSAGSAPPIIAQCLQTHDAQNSMPCSFLLWLGLPYLAKWQSTTTKFEDAIATVVCWKILRAVAFALLAVLALQAYATFAMSITENECGEGEDVDPLEHVYKINCKEDWLNLVQPVLFNVGPFSMFHKLCFWSGEPCKILMFIKEGGAIALVNMSFLGMILVMYGMRICYLILSSGSAGGNLDVRAKHFRLLFVTRVVDQVMVERMPSVFGIHEVPVAIFICSLTSAVFIIAGLRRSTGLLSLGLNSFFVSLTAASSMVGEPGSVRTIREREVITILTESMRTEHLNMDPQTLNVKMLEFLRRSTLEETIVVDLPIVVLFASLVEDGDCIRVRKYVVPDAYIQMSDNPGDHTDPETGAPNIKDGKPFYLGHPVARKDVLVDVFSRTCSVFGDYTEAPTTRWFEQGCLLPWHLALEKSAVQTIEIFFCREMHWTPGAGFFGSAPNELGEWGSVEASRSPQELDLVEDAILKGIENDGELVSNFLRSEIKVKDKPHKVVQALLRRGATPPDMYSAVALAVNAQRPKCVEALLKNDYGYIRWEKLLEAVDHARFDSLDTTPAEDREFLERVRKLFQYYKPAVTPHLGDDGRPLA
jgi:hypothetical protein